MKRRSLVAATVLSFVFGVPDCGRCEVTPRLDAELQTVLDREIERHDVRGVSAAIAFADGTLWTGVSGISHGAVEMDSAMLFGIGSVTKNVVAALALQLVEEGTISLEDEVSDHLPPIANVDGGTTIRQLLDHTSGLYNFFDSDEVWEALKADRSRVWRPEEVLSYIEEPYFEPGGGFRYSNTNYLLIGVIVERVTGSALSSELDRRFFEPLGLKAGFFDPGLTPDRMAHVYGDDFQFGAAEKDLTYEPRASHESMIFGSGGLFMTASDLARWSQALFGGEMLQDESLDEMFRFVSFRPFANMESYGLGVQTFERRFAHGVDAIGHGGGNIGSATYMVYLPEHDISVVAMVNAYPTSSIDDITRGLLRVVLRDLGELGWLPYVPVSWLLLVLSGAAAAANLLYRRCRQT